MNNKLIFAFDLGSGSMGICVRKGENILYLDSLLIDSDFASVENATKLRRQIRTRIAHKKREEWWIKQAKKAGIEVLSTAQPTKESPNLKPDERMLREFTSENSGDKTIYSSQLLRIALLQGVKLEGWQVFKAIWSAIQHRGYDSKLPWAKDANKEEADVKENKEASNRYDEKLREIFNEKKEYYYPCYYEAYIQGIWDPNEPNDLNKKLTSNPKPARNKDKKNMAIPSRYLVSRELIALLTNAAEQFPKLKGKANYVIYGPSGEKYASFEKPEYFKYRGREWDWKGLLGQKVPRFDNRIISKCRLIPRLNVCKADKMLNKEVSFLWSLKNMRYTLGNDKSKSLTCEQVKSLFKKYKGNISTKEKVTSKALINSREWKKYVQSLGGDINPNQKEIPQPKLPGRSSYCKPVLKILKKLILSGKSPHDYYSELVKSNKNTDPLKELIEDDYKFLLAMPKDWGSISIPDEREFDKGLSKEEALYKIDRILNNISNRIVRHRLLMLKEKLKELSEKYGEPGKIVFEIAREDFTGKNPSKKEDKKAEYIEFQNDNKKEREEAKKTLEEYKINISNKNILRARLYKSQKGKDIYDTSEKRDIVISKLEDYEIDHILPRTPKRGGSDSLANMVITKATLNADKGDRTPYEWFHEESKDWDSYVKNIEEIFGSDKKYKSKVDLLISDRAAEFDSRRTDLQATAYIEKTAQRLTSLYFNWGMNTEGDRKRILFFTGGETATVRRSLGLNRILFPNLTDEEYKNLKPKGKNRENDRHHALDALVLSVLPEIELNFKKVEKKPDFFNKEFCEKEINKVYPRLIKQTTPKLRETFYGLRCRLEKNEKTGKLEKAYYFISHFDSSINNFKHLEGEKTRKKVERIFDLKIKKDFQEELNRKDLTQEKWEEFLKEYTDNYAKIKKIALIDSKRFKESEIFNSDGTVKNVIDGYGHRGAVKGQWIRGKESHQGQIIYRDEKDKWKVVPVYVFESIYVKRKIYEDKYKDIKFFRSGQLVELRKDSQNIKSGIYKLRTIRTNGDAEINDMSNNKMFRKNINVFIEQNGMTIYEK